MVAQDDSRTQARKFKHIYTFIQALVNLLTSVSKEIQQILKEILGHRKRSAYRRCEMRKIRIATLKITKRGELHMSFVIALLTAQVQ